MALTIVKLLQKNLVNEILQNVDDATENHQISLENFTLRRRHNNNQPIPHTRQEINIPDELRTTKNSPAENFLLHETCNQNQNRIIAFSSDTDIR